MCGIAGVVGPIGEDQARNLASRMVEAVVHRGPDDCGIWSTNGFAFGMRRLSIIDLAGGHQPIWRGHNLGIVMNGEIYNYSYLKQKLLRLGYEFATNSDTEVALACYEEFGERFVESLDGMFSIAIIDLAARRLLLARDRLGKKPMYFGRLGSNFFFGSEIKSIVAALNTKLELDYASINQYLSFRYVPFPNTMWRHVYKLPPAHRLDLNIDTLESECTRYWKINFSSEAQNPNRAYQQEFRSHFLEAVEKRLLASDVPVGVFLSGGLDSSAVCAAARELGFKNVHTFSVGHSDQGKYNETGLAEAVANHLGFQHRSIILEREAYYEHLDEVVWATDDPLADMSTIPLLVLSRAARSDVKVVLSGEGGDEIFGGYKLDREARIADRVHRSIGRIPRSLLRLLTLIPFGRRREVLRDIVHHGWAGYLWHWRPYAEHFSEAKKRALWKPEVFSPGPGASSDLILELFDQCKSEEAIDILMTANSQQWLVEDLLMKADKITMAASLELRCPFLDHKLVEWAGYLPLSQKIGNEREGYTTKRIVREYCAARLPEFVVTRPKLGFETPVAEWLNEPAEANRIESAILHNGSRLLELFRIPPIQAELSAARGGSVSAAKNVWVLLVLERWLARWN